jgi:hypothetical protein
VIEHIISGIKRCRIVKDIFRNTKEKYDDLVISKPTPHAHNACKISM